MSICWQNNCNVLPSWASSGNAYKTITTRVRVRYLLSGLVYVHEVNTGTEGGVLTIQEYVLNHAGTY